MPTFPFAHTVRRIWYQDGVEKLELFLKRPQVLNTKVERQAKILRSNWCHSSKKHAVMMGPTRALSLCRVKDGAAVTVTSQNQTFLVLKSQMGGGMRTSLPEFPKRPARYVAELGLSDYN